MPPKSNYRKKKYKKRYNKSYNKGKKSFKRDRRNGYVTTVIKGPRVIGDRLRTKLVYTSIVQCSGAAFNAVYFGNCPYDPTLGTPTRQPAGFDDMAALYREYICYGSKIRAQVMGTSAAGGNYCTITIVPTVQLISTENTVDMASQPYAVNGLNSGNPGMNKITLTNYIQTKKIFGKKILQEEDFGAFTAPTNVANGIPVKPWYWNVMLQSINSNDQLAGVYFILEIIYYVDFFGRRIRTDVIDDGATGPTGIVGSTGTVYGFDT